MKITKSAWRLLEFFRWFWRKGDGCFPKLRYLADKFQVTSRTIRRWTSELAIAGWLRKLRSGRGKGCQYVPVDKPEGNNSSSLFLPGDVRSECPVSTLDSEVDGIKTKQARQNRPVENKPKSQPQESHANETGFSPTEKRAVADAVESHRRPDGSGFVCSPGLVRRLERIALFYGANGFQAAAELERVRRTDLESRSRWPERDAWFCVVLESRLKRREAKSMGREERSGAVFLGWSAEEIAAIEQQAADGAAETLAQPEKAKRTPDIPKPAVMAQSEEYCDTREMLAQILDARRWPAA